MKKETEPQKIQIIGPVNTNTENPWRKKEEYIKEQAQMTKIYNWSRITAISAIVTAFFTAILAVTAIIEIKNISKQTLEYQEKQNLANKD